MTNQEVVIVPNNKGILLNVKIYFRHTDLIKVLTWREIIVRYKQTIIGSLWAIIQPLVTMIALTIIVHGFMEVGTNDIPYAIFSMSGLVPWIYFTHSLTKATICLPLNYPLITKMSFPKAVLPISAVLASFVDYLISLTVLLLMMPIYGLSVTWKILFLPCFSLLGIILSLGIGFWFSAVNIRFRDVTNLLPFITQIWFFITPVAYSSDIVPEKWRWLFALNPVTGIIEGLRWCLFDYDIHSFSNPLLSLLSISIISISGLLFFQYQENEFADII